MAKPKPENASDDLRGTAPPLALPQASTDRPMPRNGDRRGLQGNDGLPANDDPFALGDYRAETPPEDYVPLRRDAYGLPFGGRRRGA